jgi:hypothetical protein
MEHEFEETPTPPTGSIHTQQLLTPLRESIIEKPPYISFSFSFQLLVSHSYIGSPKTVTLLGSTVLGAFWSIAADILCHRHINLANATPDELEQLTHACEPASFGVNKEDVLDETYRKAGKLDSECFAPLLDPVRTDLSKIIRGYLLEGTQSMKNIKIELYKLNVYGMHPTFIFP